ncbi:hypothetical protein [Mycobacteroides chelonae]|uniref:hypothetical protein n=1 Tax=Mycobacteroides chelonae TaxID=1774 RepID=UPI0009925804|nr:hypothetical protein [Mycobacteroides chelonae]
MSSFVEDLRAAHPNASVTVKLNSSKYGFTASAGHVLSEFDHLATQAEESKAEADRWRAVAESALSKLEGVHTGIWEAAKWLEDHYDGEPYEIYNPAGTEGYRLQFEKLGPHPTSLATTHREV